MVFHYQQQGSNQGNIQDEEDIDMSQDELRQELEQLRELQVQRFQQRYQEWRQRNNLL